MKRRRIDCTLIYYLIVFAIIFAYAYFSEAAEDKDTLIVYIKDVSSIMTNVDIMIRNIGLKSLPMNEGVKRMDTYISQIRAIQYPGDLSKLHKMILLSFKKIRMGLLLFSVEARDESIRLIRSGSRLLKYAAGDIVDIAKREDLIKKEEKTEEKGKSTK